MTDSPTTRGFYRLFEALQNFCDPVLVNTLRTAELGVAEYQHRDTNRPLLSSLDTIRKASTGDWRDMPDGMADFHEAWDRLIENFKGLIEFELLELDGVQIAPAATTDRTPIPCAWSALMTFDFRENTISTGYHRYASVRVRRAPRPELLGKDSTPPMPSSLPCGLTLDATGKVALNPDAVSLLTDDTLLALLEEHGRRVVGTPDAKLVMPGRVSFLAIIRRKLLARAEGGQLLPTLRAEADYLERWIAAKIDHHHIPTSGTIAKVLAGDYAAEKARSSAAIQKLNP